MPKGRKNLYRCQACRESIVTLDLDEGTTPMFLGCHVTPKCKGLMASTMYRNPQGLPHQYEFFRPASLDGYGPDMLEHLEKGGLSFRRREFDLASIPDQALARAIDYARTLEAISIVELQRKFKLIFPDAARLMQELRLYGVIHLNKNKSGSYYIVKEVSWRK